MHPLMIGVVASYDGRRWAGDLFEGVHVRVPLADAHQDLPDGTIVRVIRADGRLDGQPLAAPGSGRAALYAIVARYGLHPLYPTEAEAEAEAWVAEPGLDDPALEDRTDLAFITIDNQDSRDLDQAMYIQRGPDGGYVVDYALADASYYIRPRSALFRDALQRGASFYLPGLVIPMLPRNLSEGIISLNPGVLRRALVFRMRLDAAGLCLETSLGRALIRSRAKLSYDGVQRFYDTPARSDLAGRDFSETLDLLREVGRLRIAAAEANDVIQYNRVSVNISLQDPEGIRFCAVGETRNDTERYNEQISLLCNVEGARFLARSVVSDDALRPVFRVHPAPEPPSFGHLLSLIAAMVTEHGLDPGTWLWRRDAGETLADYLQRLPTQGAARPFFLAIQRQALIINQRSSFTAEPGLHFGVGAPFYSRFSSPMREMVGIYTHKEAFESLANLPSQPGDEVLHDTIINAANRAKEVQRNLTKEANRLVLDQLFSADMALRLADRPWRRGTVLGLKAAKLYVMLEQPPLEVKVYLADLAATPADRVTEDASGVGVDILRSGRRSRFCLGDTISIRVVRRDSKRRRWSLEPSPLPG